MVAPYVRVCARCSDLRLRLWSVETGNVLCSTPYYMAPPAAPGDAAVHGGNGSSGGGGAWEPEQLLSLALSDAEDILIGGYDVGYRYVPLTRRSLTPLAY